MADYTLHSYTAYVDVDGTIGVGGLLTFAHDSLTNEQWNTLSNLGDSQRMGYVWAVLNDEPLTEWEENK